MADLKFTECENRRDIEGIKDGEFTDYMFMMYRKGEDGWYRNTILPVSGFSGGVSSAAALCGLCVRESIRVTLDKNGKAAFFAADAVIDRLCEKGKSLGLPEVDKVYAGYALRELIKLERIFLSEKSLLIAHISLFGMDLSCAYPVKQAMFTISLEYREKKSLSQTVIADVLPQTEIIPGSCGYMGAVYRGRAGAQAAGYDNVMWLDCVYRKYIPGIGGQSVFFRTENEVITPPAREDFMTEAVKLLMKDWGLCVSERRVSLDELIAEYKKGNILEVFGVSDTDGVMCVTEIDAGDDVLELSGGKLAKKLSDSIANIEKGVLGVPRIKLERV